MKLLIDDARITEIRRLYDLYPVDGVTTNPSILAKAGGKPFDVLKSIRAFIGADAELHVQVAARTAEGMVLDGRRIVNELGRNTYVKIPAVAEGFQAIRALTGEGIRTTGTAVYTPMQAYLAAKSGALWVAPYVNRIDGMGFDGVQTVKDIHDLFLRNGLNAQVLAASFKNTRQVQALCVYGIGAATLAPDVLDGLAHSDAVNAAIDRFVSDFEGLAGKGRTMGDC